MKSLFNHLKENFKRYASIYLFSFASAGIVAALLYAAANQLGADVTLLTHDPHRAAGVEFYYGYGSLFGSVIWLIGGVATLTTALLSHKVLESKFSDGGIYGILLIGGVLGSIMGIDDILMFHDSWIDVIGLDDYEPIFPILYGLGILALLVSSRKVIHLTPWPILFASLLCLGISTGMDLHLFARKSSSEDVYKICAIVLWAIYFLQVSWAHMEAAGERRKKRE